MVRSISRSEVRRVFAVMSGAAAVVFAVLNTLMADDLSMEILAGEYHIGDALAGSTLELSPSGRFHYSFSGCHSSSVSMDGSADISGGILRLKPDNGMKFMDRLGPRMQPIRWGERMYLIQPESLEDFAREVELGREPEGAGFGVNFYRRDTDASKPIRGLPLTLRRWGFEEGELIQVTLGEPDQQGTFRLNRGSRHGLRASQRLRIVEGTSLGDVVIWKLGASSAVAVVHFDSEYQRPESGQVLTLRIPPTRGWWRYGVSE